MQNLKIYVSVLATIVAAQSYGAAGVASAGAADIKTPSPVVAGSQAPLGDALAHCGGALARFLDARSLGRLVMADKGSKIAIESLPVFKLNQAIGLTDFIPLTVDLDRIRAALTPADQLYLKAMSLPKTNTNRGTIRDHLENAKKGGSILARKTLNEEASDQSFLFTNTEGFRYLTKQVESGDTHASKILNIAAFRGEHGFTKESGLEYLKKRALSNDQNAQELLNQVANSESLGFDAVSGLTYLKDRIAAGDTHAQMMLNHAAFCNRLGFDDVTGRHYLETRITLGDTNAQELFNAAADSGGLGFDAVTGLAYLKNRAYTFNDQSALEKLAYAAKEEKLGLGYKYLEQAVEVGDIYAQRIFNSAAAQQGPYWGRFGNVHTGRAYLEDRVRRFQDQDALKHLLWAANRGYLGFSGPDRMYYVWKHVKWGHSVRFDSPLFTAILDLRKYYHSRI